MEYIPAKTVVSSYSGGNGWFGNNYNMNIYKGCCHGCIYCDSRSECYGINDFDTVRAKENALAIIRNNLRSKVKTGVVGTGSMSDPYNPYEKELVLTGHALELINAYDFGVSIATKSALITRDIEILKEIKEHSPVICEITITCHDDRLASKLEPNVSSPSERFKAIRQLSDNGIFCGILLMPVLPFINDTYENITGIVTKAHEAGARFIYPAFGVTLRQNQREWFYNKLDELFPGKLLREKYIRSFGNNYECRSPGASKLWKLFRELCDGYGILYDMKDIVFTYKQGYGINQLSFFND